MKNPLPSATTTASAPAAAGAAAPFDDFRSRYPAKPLPPERVANQDQVKQMVAADGLMLWSAGKVDVVKGHQPATPTITPAQDASKHLWTVETNRVPYAPEQCAFGKTLESRVIKHSNLTGGGSAHCAGEMVKIDADSIVINGRSGRYGPKSGAEMEAIAKAFRASGYNVWSMGFDAEAATALPFLGVTPVWIP